MELDWINFGFKFATDFTLKKEVIITVWSHLFSELPVQRQGQSYPNEVKISQPLVSRYFYRDGLHYLCILLFSQDILKFNYKPFQGAIVPQDHLFGFLSEANPHIS